MAEAVFLRLLDHDNRATALADSVDALHAGKRSNRTTFAVDPASFAQVPGSPFAYWVSNKLRRIFTEVESLEQSDRNVRVGLATTSDPRFVRLWFEVSPRDIRCSDWALYAKGGTFSVFYQDIHLVDDWKDSGCRIKARVRQMGDAPSRYVASEDMYSQPGLTYPRRTQRGFNVRAMPAGAIFANKGPSIFVKGNDKFMLLCLLGMMNSTPFRSLLSLQTAFGSFEVGVVQRTPIADLTPDDARTLSELTESAVEWKRALDTTNETSHVFLRPTLLQVCGSTLAERVGGWGDRIAEAEHQLAENQRRIDEIAFQLYGIEGEDRRAIEERAGRAGQAEGGLGEDTDSEDGEIEALNSSSDAALLVAQFLSYAAGCSVGRWDVCFATGDRQPPELPDPFAPLLVCSSGMLQGPDGLPATPEDVPSDYPLRIDRDGVLVDDAEHQDDIIRRVRDVLEVIWNERADAIEKEACEILGVKTLRDYFRKPGKGGFWDDHVKRYSKSRRKAPVYWLLQSSKKNYALWLYYHRLDKDMLFKALLNYVEPKIQREENRLAELRSQKSSAALTPDPSPKGRGGTSVKKLDRDIEKQEDLLSELRDFEEKLRNVANLHLTPDLNDGVVLNIAPLHELVPWKEAKKYWDHLMEGNYEWSSIGKQLREKGLVTE